MADLKDSRAQSRLEKAARESGNAWVHYEVEAKAVREKTARLRALRNRQGDGGQKCSGRGGCGREEVGHKEVRQINRGVHATSVAGRSTKRWAARLTARLTGPRTRKTGRLATPARTSGGHRPRC